MSFNNTASLLAAALAAAATNGSTAPAPASHMPLGRGDVPSGGPSVPLYQFDAAPYSQYSPDAWRYLPQSGPSAQALTSATAPELESAAKLAALLSMQGAQLSQPAPSINPGLLAYHQLQASSAASTHAQIDLLEQLRRITTSSTSSSLSVDLNVTPSLSSLMTNSLNSSAGPSIPSSDFLTSSLSSPFSNSMQLPVGGSSFTAMPQFRNPFWPPSTAADSLTGPLLAAKHNGLEFPAAVAAALGQLNGNSFGGSADAHGGPFANKRPAEGLEPSEPASKQKAPKRKKKDAEAPKHPLSAYLFYVAEQRHAMAKDIKHAHHSFSDVAKIVGDQWKKLTPKQREPYEQRAQEDKRRYEQEKREYIRKKAQALRANPNLGKDTSGSETSRSPSSSSVDTSPLERPSGGAAPGASGPAGAMGLSSRALTSTTADHKLADAAAAAFAYPPPAYSSADSVPSSSASLSNLHALSLASALSSATSSPSMDSAHLQNLQALQQLLADARQSMLRSPEPSQGAARGSNLYGGLPAPPATDRAPGTGGALDLSGLSGQGGSNIGLRFPSIGRTDSQSVLNDGSSVYDQHR